MKFRLQVFLHLLKEEDDFSAAVQGSRSTQLLTPSSLTCLDLPFFAGSPSVCHSSDVLMDNKAGGLPVCLFLLNCVGLYEVMREIRNREIKGICVDLWNILKHVRAWHRQARCYYHYQ